MKRLTFLSAAAVFLFINLAAIGQEKNITVITEDPGEEDGDFFAFMPEMPPMPDLGDLEITMGMGPGFGWNEEAGGPIGMPDELKLTKEQTDKIKKIRIASRKQNIPIKSDIQLKEIELKEMMDADSPDRNAVAAKIKEIDALRTQIKINRLHARIDCRSVLTKEQKEKMEQMRADRRMMHFDGRKHKMKFKREKFGE